MDARARGLLSPSRLQIQHLDLKPFAERLKQDIAATLKPDCVPELVQGKCDLSKDDLLAGGKL
jgi:hypothetical protein